MGSAAISCSSAGASASRCITAAKGVAEDLVRDADVAMYAAKDAGRGSYAVFEATWHVSSARCSAEAGAPRRLEREEFLLHTSRRSRSNLDDRRRRGARRWNSPKRRA